MEPISAEPVQFRFQPLLGLDGFQEFLVEREVLTFEGLVGVIELLEGLEEERKLDGRRVSLARNDVFQRMRREVVPGAVLHQVHLEPAWTPVVVGCGCGCGCGCGFIRSCFWRRRGL